MKYLQSKKFKEQEIYNIIFNGDMYMKKGIEQMPNIHMNVGRRFKLSEWARSLWTVYCRFIPRQKIK
jgi:hypothetical protein